MAAAAEARCHAAIAAATAWIYGAAATGLWCQAVPSAAQPLGWHCRPGTQIQSNALAALEALDTYVAQRVYEEGCITGDRINGLCDGVTGDWCAGGGGRGSGCCRRVAGWGVESCAARCTVSRWGVLLASVGGDESC